MPDVSHNKNIALYLSSSIQSIWHALVLFAKTVTPILILVKISNVASLLASSFLCSSKLKAELCHWTLCLEYCKRIDTNADPGVILWRILEYPTALFSGDATMAPPSGATCFESESHGLDELCIPSDDKYLSSRFKEVMFKADNRNIAERSDSLRQLTIHPRLFTEAEEVPFEEEKICEATHFDIPSYFSLDLSTEENYKADSMQFHGSFQSIRATLDYSYHGNYIQSRQLFQDTIVEKLLDGTIIKDPSGRVCKTPTEPWILFTAGVMGAGKSHTIKQLSSKGLFPLQSFVVIDPDDIRQHFPEFQLYAALSPQKAGELTHKEAGYVTEIVTAAALKRGHNVLVDGSLRDSEWYRNYFEQLRREYNQLRIAIIHVTAPREAVFERAHNRAIVTGRVVPHETLELSLIQVPRSINKLSPLADFFCELDNAPASGGVKISTENITWESFSEVWLQTCPWPPEQKSTF